MIFVTVGTTGFDALVKQIDLIASDHIEDFVIQIGPGTYIPQNCDYFRYEPSLNTYYERATLIISHGGLATVTEVLQKDKPLVAVEDQFQPDRHQREILNIWGEEGYLLWCKDLSNILDCIAKARTMEFATYKPPTCDIPDIIQQFIDAL